MVKPGTYEEIMRRSSTYVDDFTMSLQIPLSDWSGYFLFAAIDGDGSCQAVNLGVCIGLVNGAEHGVPQWDGDPYRLFVINACICDGVSYRVLDDSSYTRSDVIYSRSGLDLQVGQVVRVRGPGPTSNCTSRTKYTISCTNWKAAPGMPTGSRTTSSGAQCTTTCVSRISISMAPSRFEAASTGSKA